MIHADRTQVQRDNVVKSFREGKIWVLICTELISRGIDFLGVNLVVNYDFPVTAISYIHRIGRTGRAGRKGKAVTYFTQEDKPRLRSIANIMQNSGCKVPEFMLTIKKQSKKVRRQLEKTVPKRDDVAIKNPNQIYTKKRKLSSANVNGGDNTKSASNSHGKRENFVSAPKKRKTAGNEKKSKKTTK